VSIGLFLRSVYIIVYHITCISHWKWTLCFSYLYYALINVFLVILIIALCLFINYSLAAVYQNVTI
jgi:hypothetical protein